MRYSETGADTAGVAIDMRFLHTMLRVSDVDASLDFYCNKFGLKEMRRKDVTAGRFTLIFLAAPKDMAGSEANGAPELELTYNWDTSYYEHGNAFGHIAIEVDDIYKICVEIKDKGAKVIRDPGPMMGSKLLLAFIEDPNGYKIELIEKGTF